MFKFSSLSRILAWSLLFTIFLVTISPIGLRPHTLTTVNLDRGAAFAAISMLFVLGYPDRWKRIGAWAPAPRSSSIRSFADTTRARRGCACEVVGRLVGVLSAMHIIFSARHRRLPLVRGLRRTDTNSMLAVSDDLDVQVPVIAPAPKRKARTNRAYRVLSRRITLESNLCPEGLGFRSHR